MADSTVGAMTAITTPSDTDVIYVEHDPSGTPADRSFTWANLKAAIAAAPAATAALAASIRFYR